MRARLLTTALVLLVLEISWSQTLQDDLQARYGAFNRAIQNHDTKFFDTYLSPTFTADIPGGKLVDRSSTVQAFTDLMNGVQTSNWTFKLSNLHVVSKGVELTAVGDFRATGVGPDKKKHRIALQGVTNDRWVLIGNRWMLDHVSFQKLNGTIDGKPAPIPGLAP